MPPATPCFRLFDAAPSPGAPPPTTAEALGPSARSNHGQYVRCMKFSTRDMQARGVLTRESGERFPRRRLPPAVCDERPRPRGPGRADGGRDAGPDADASPEVAAG